MVSDISWTSKAFIMPYKKWLHPSVDASRSALSTDPMSDFSINLYENTTSSWVLRSRTNDICEDNGKKKCWFLEKQKWVHNPVSLRNDLFWCPAIQKVGVFDEMVLVYRMECTIALWGVLKTLRIIQIFGAGWRSSAMNGKNCRRRNRIFQFFSGSSVN